MSEVTQRWSKEGEFAEALQNGTTLGQQLAAKEAENAELRAALEAAANALAWAERRMACEDYAGVIANDERNARAALGSDRHD